MISGEPLPKAWELAGCPPQQGRPESPLAAVGEGRGLGKEGTASRSGKPRVQLGRGLGPWWTGQRR